MFQLTFTLATIAVVRILARIYSNIYHQHCHYSTLNVILFYLVSAKHKKWPNKLHTVQPSIFLVKTLWIIVNLTTHPFVSPCSLFQKFPISHLRPGRQVLHQEPGALRIAHHFLHLTMTRVGPGSPVLNAIHGVKSPLISRVISPHLSLGFRIRAHLADDSIRDLLKTKSLEVTISTL